MRALLQRVDSASVVWEGVEPRAIGRGLLILLGVCPSDTPQTAARLADKLARLRVFPNEEGKFDRSLLDIRGEALVVPQFTLYGETKGGRRPDFTGAARPEQARPLCDAFADALAGLGVAAKRGGFGEAMKVSLVNDGPVTLLVDSERL